MNCVYCTTGHHDSAAQVRSCFEANQLGPLNAPVTLAEIEVVASQIVKECSGGRRAVVVSYMASVCAGTPDLLDSSHVFEGKRETSRATAEFTSLGRANTWLRRVMDAIICEPRSDEQLTDDLHMNPNTERPRRCDLEDWGLVRDSGRRHTARSGQEVIVWEATEAGRLAASVVPLK